jgi:hypothetical protein
VLRTMSKDPAARFADATAMARALLPFASHRVQVSYGQFLGPGIADTLLNAQPPPRTVLQSTHGSTFTPLAHSVLRAPVSKGYLRWVAPLLLLAAAALGLGLWLHRPSALGPETSLPSHQLQPMAAAPAIAASAVTAPLAPEVVHPAEPHAAAAQPVQTADAGAARLADPKEQLRKRLSVKTANKRAATPRSDPPASEDIWNDRR